MLNRTFDPKDTILVVGSSSTLSKALVEVFPHAIFFGRTNPYNIHNWYKIESLARPEGIEHLKTKLVDAMVDKTHQIHVVFLQGISSSNWEESIYVNLISVAETSQFIAEILRDTGRTGSITFVGTASSTLGGKMQYSSTKAALAGVQNTLLNQYKGIIRVNHIVPGVFDGGMTQDWDETKKQNISNKTHARRFAHPSEISNAIAFLIKNDYVTGAYLNMTSGQIK